MYLRHMLLEIRKKTILEFIFIPSTMSIFYESFKHLKLPISIKIYVTILQIVYICMSTAFSNSSL